MNKGKLKRFMKEQGCSMIEAKAQFKDKLQFTEAEIFERDVRDLCENPRDEYDAYLVSEVDKDFMAQLMVEAGLDKEEKQVDATIRMKSYQWCKSNEPDLTVESCFGYVLCQYVIRDLANHYLETEDLEGIKLNCHGQLVEFSGYGPIFIQDLNQSTYPEVTLKQLVEPFIE